MANIFKTVGKIFSGAALVFVLGTNFVSAASMPDAREAFQEAMQKTQADKRIFREDIYFVVPTMQNELEFIVSADDKNFKAAGDFTSWFTDETGTTTDMSIPFYLTQTDKDMQIYFQLDKKWYNFQTPSLAAVATDIIATPSESESKDFFDDVKDVALLQETENRRILLVRLDGDKIADEIKAEAEKNPADNGTADDKELHNSFLKYLDNGLRNSDIWYTWTINKQTWQTTAISLNLSGLVQATAQAALNDPEQNFDDNIREMLETVAFLSETKAYTTYLNDTAANKLEVPKKALKAEKIKDIIPETK